MILLFLTEIYHISTLDGSANTYALGKVWEILSIHISRRANVVGFDHKVAVKRNLPIVSALVLEIVTFTFILKAIFNYH